MTVPDPSLLDGGALPGPRRDRPAGRMLVYLGIVAVVVLIGGLGVLVAGRLPGPGTSPAPGRSETPLIPTAAAALESTPSSSAAGTSASPDPSSSPASLQDQVAQVEAQVPPIRDLEPLTPVTNRIEDEAQLRADMTASFDTANPAGELEAETALLERLGLLEPGTDVRALYLDAQTQQVLGYYDDRTKQMTLVQRGASFGPLDRMTLSHEYTHALQDQRFGLQSLGLDERGRTDRDLARLSLVEGDASIVMMQWATQHLTQADLAQVLQESNDPVAQAALDRLPPILRQQAMFPYETGMTFALQLFMSGGWDAIDRAYASPPDSTEQVLHPDMFKDRERPIDVVVPALAGPLGAGWSETYADTLGEAGIRVWLERGVDSSVAATAAAGWGGDRVASLDGPGGTWAVAWILAWDSAADAEEFAAAADPAVGPLGHAVVRHAAGSATVTVLAAGDTATLGKLEAAVPAS
jgi:hypothetical protein